MAEQENNMKLLPHWNKTKSEVWKFFGFESESDGKSYKDRSKVVCNRCFIKMPYTTCTTNMSSHINRYHYEDRHGKIQGGTGAQLTLQKTLERRSVVSLSSQRGKDICRSIVRYTSFVFFV